MPATLKFLFIKLMLVIALMLQACVPQEPGGIPGIVRIGVLPDQDAATLRQRYVPFTQYLAEQTGYEVMLVSVSDYDALVEEFGRGEIDMALFGGYTYLLARQQYDAHALVLRDSGHKYHSSFIASRDDPRERVEEFEGEVLVFGSPRSTSGHMMPRFFLERWKMVPEEKFSEVRFSGTHSATIAMVEEGKGYLGAANGIIVADYLREQGDGAGVKIIRNSPGYTDYTWAVQPGMPAEQKLALRDALLTLSPADSEHAAVLASIRARGFLPALREDFAELEQVMAGLSDE